MTQREAWMVAVLSLVTCGVYGLYWHYTTTEELKVVSSRTDFSGMMDVLLGLVTCGIWLWFAEYRNAQVVTELMTRRGIAHQDRAQTILLLNCLTLVVGMTGVVARMVLQDEFNKVAQALGGPTSLA